MADPDLSVVVPVYQNAETVTPLAERLERVLVAEGLSYEIIFVDDACPAGSLHVLGGLARRDPRVAVVSLERNEGQHRAVLAGLKRARGRAVATMDADLQDPPEALPAMLRQLGEGYAAVFAGRRGRYESRARLLTSRLFKTLLHRLSGVPADAGMFVVMTRPMVASLLACRERRPFVVALIGASGLPVSSIPVERFPRPGGASTYSSWMRLTTGCRALGSALLAKWATRRPGHESAEGHNQFQRAYFERVLKRNMVPSGSRYLRRHVEELLRFGGISAGERVIEVGCGMGRYTLLLAERGIRVEGLDLSPVLLDRLRGYAPAMSSIPLHCGEIENPPAGLEGQFEVVVGLFVLHHLQDLRQCLAAVARLLKPGGRAVFLEPNPYNPLFYVQMMIKPDMTWKGDRGMLRMRRRVIFEALTQAGFSQPRLRRFGFFPPFLANRRLGASIETGLERFRPLYPLLPFQLFRAERS